MGVAIKYRLILAIFLIPIFLFSQNRYNLSQFWTETGDYYSSPFHWNKNDFLTLGIIAAGTLTSMQFDQSIKDEVKKINSNNKFWLMEAGRFWGEPIPTFALSSIFLIHGIASEDNTSKKIGFEIIQSFIYSVSVTSGLKIMIGRARPYAESSAKTFSPLALHDANLSLPSGHTTVAFSLSTVLAESTDNNGLKLLAFIPAILTATSRVYQNYHWTSDVLLGAAIGYFTGKFVTDLHNKNEISNTITNTPLISFSLAF